MYYFLICYFFFVYCFFSFYFFSFLFSFLFSFYFTLFLFVEQVREMNAAGVMDEIERIAVEAALSIIDGRGFGFRVPTRSSGNQKFVEELDRIVLGDKVKSMSPCCCAIYFGMLGAPLHAL